MVIHSPNGRGTKRRRRMYFYDGPQESLLNYNYNLQSTVFKLKGIRDYITHKWYNFNFRFFVLFCFYYIIAQNGGVHRIYQTFNIKFHFLNCNTYAIRTAILFSILSMYTTSFLSRWTQIFRREHLTDCPTPRWSLDQSIPKELPNGRVLRTVHNNCR